MSFLILTHLRKMDTQQFEELIIKNLESVIDTIIKNNLTPNISAKARAGAEISDLLEKEFVKQTNGHQYFINSESSPQGATKNPWDAKTYFKLNNHEELIWIDFKAVKVSGEDSNPDIGTPNKVFDLIKEHNAFYLTYIYVYYKETNNGIEFVKGANNKFAKIYFLKDVSHTFRRTPKNQLQINISAEPEYRTREEFIKLLLTKIKESHRRQIEISQKALKELEESNLLNELLEKNSNQEDIIKNL